MLQRPAKILSPHQFFLHNKTFGESAPISQESEIWRATKKSSMSIGKKTRVRCQEKCPIKFKNSTNIFIYALDIRTIQGIKKKKN